MVGRVVVACGTALAVSFAPPVGATGPCDALSNGSLPELTDISSLVAKAKDTKTEKDEFETIAQFNNRINASLEQISDGRMIFVSFPVSGRDIKYDADNEYIYIDKFYLLGCTNIDYEAKKQIEHLTFADSKYKFSPICVRRLVSSEGGGSYEASNAYGATASVRVSEYRAEGLFLGFGDSLVNIFTGKKQDNPSDPLLSAAATPDEARSLKKSATIIFGFYLRPPIYIQTIDRTFPTFTNPTKTTTTNDLLVADVKCAAIADKVSGRLFAYTPMAGME